MSERALEAVLHAALGQRVTQLRAVSGGDINHARCATLEDGARVFVKTQAHAPAAFFEREAQGLHWLDEAAAVRIPRVLAFADAQDGTPAFLALEWIEPGKRVRDHDEQLGRGLAALHRSGAPSFGFANDNFLATLPQANAPRADWPSFYAQRRLLPLFERARAKELFSTQHARALDRVIERVLDRSDALCGPSEPPSRLHGDLWGGNAIVDAAGLPVLIDPAVYGGHREIDLAMMRLFGGFGARCFAAYEEAFPLAPGHEERVALYQLYPLLAHVCLFGASYVSAVLRAIEQLNR